MSRQSEAGDKTGWKRGEGPYSKSAPKVTNQSYDKERDRGWAKDGKPEAGSKEY